MNKLFIFSLLLIAAVQMTFAQRGTDQKELKDEIREQRDSLIREHRMEALMMGKDSSTAGPSALDVGEPDSFGKNAKFMGTVQAGLVLFQSSCSPADVGTLGPDDRCVVITPTVPIPTTTFNDIGRITIPGKSLDNVLYSIANNTVNVNFQNTTATASQGRFTYIPTLTIQSDVLNDPTLIDPTTNLPFNGSFTTGNLGTLNETRTIAPASLEVQTNSYTRANTLGFSRTFFTSLGLPNNVIDQLYKKPMTLKLNVRFSGRLIESGVINFSIRFLGN